MNTLSLPSDMIGKLREAVARMRKHRIQEEIVERRDEVLARYQPIFSPEHVPRITEDELKSFLLFENNRHWSGLHRQGNRICRDMDALRKGLSLLLDETQPLAERLDKANKLISGMGKNIASAILVVYKPDTYGVWNNPSEMYLKQVGLWPDFERGLSFGQRYERINEILAEICRELSVDFWTLDTVWWFPGLELEDGETKIRDGAVYSSDPPEPGCTARFGLERHLHEFMRDN